MLLTITNTLMPATDFGYLLFKNPGKLHTKELSFGKAHLFYPEATEERCTVAVLLDVDPVALVRGRHSGGESGPLAQYVNDRPYVASSFMSVAIGQLFGTAMTGRSKDRPELAKQPLPLTVTIPVLPCHGGEILLRRLFEPLGYIVTATRHILDDNYPEWGLSYYYSVELSASVKISELLTHLYVLIPVLDDEKHYWVGDDEVEKLLRHGEGWLSSHPERELIANRYLKHQRSLTRELMSQLIEEEAPCEDEIEEIKAAEELALEETVSLNTKRMDAVVSVLIDSGAHSVLDLGCGEGRLIRSLLKNRQFDKILGMDVSCRILEKAKDRLRLEGLPQMQQDRVELIQGSLMYRDSRLSGYEAAAVVEVIEHLDSSRLAAFERVLFEFAHPATVVLTTPNREYNVKWSSLPDGKMRHRDHRFEWTRQEFQSWTSGIAKRFGYSVTFHPVGDEDDLVGSATQMGIFKIER